MAEYGEILRLGIHPRVLFPDPNAMATWDADVDESFKEVLAKLFPSEPDILVTIARSIVGHSYAKHVLGFAHKKTSPQKPDIADVSRHTTGRKVLDFPELWKENLDKAQKLIAKYRIEKPLLTAVEDKDRLARKFVDELTRPSHLPFFERFLELGIEHLIKANKAIIIRDPSGNLVRSIIIDETLENILEVETAGLLPASTVMFINHQVSPNDRERSCGSIHRRLRPPTQDPAMIEELKEYLDKGYDVELAGDDFTDDFRRDIGLESRTDMGTTVRTTNNFDTAISEKLDQRAVATLLEEIPDSDYFEFISDSEKREEILAAIEKLERWNSGRGLNRPARTLLLSDSQVNLISNAICSIATSVPISDRDGTIVNVEAIRAAASIKLEVARMTFLDLYIQPLSGLSASLQDIIEQTRNLEDLDISTFDRTTYDEDTTNDFTSIEDAREQLARMDPAILDRISALADSLGYDPQRGTFTDPTPPSREGSIADTIASSIVWYNSTMTRLTQDLAEINSISLRLNNARGLDF